MNSPGGSVSSPAWLRGAVVVPLLFLACAKAPRTEYVRVEVPIPVPCPEPPALAMPDLEISRLRPDSSPDQVAKAAVSDIATLRARLADAIRYLEAYRKRGEGHGTGQ